MFKSILEAFDATRIALSSDAALVRQILLPLGRIDEALSQRAVAYVTDGSEATVLSELAQHAARASLLLGKPGRLRWSFSAANDERQVSAEVEDGMAARHALYRRIEVKPADLALLERLGRLFEAADDGQSLERTGTSAPDWLQYVLNDALWGTLPSDVDARDPARLLPLRPAWDIGLLRALLAETGLPQALALNIVFERQEIGMYYNDQVYRRLLAPGALDADLLAHPDEVAFAAKTLSVDGKMFLADRIASDAGLRQAYAALLVRLAAGDSKTVRAAVARYLDALGSEVSEAELAVVLREGQGEERANAAELLARLRGARAEQLLEEALQREASKPVQQAIRHALAGIRAAGDAADITLPEPRPAPPVAETRIADDALALLLANREELLERLRLDAEQEKEANRDAQRPATWRIQQYEYYRQLDTGQLRDALRALNGEGDGRILENRSVNDTLALAGRLASRADFGLLQALRWDLNARPYDNALWFGPQFQKWLRRQDLSQVDLRQLSEAAARCGAAPTVFASACLSNGWARYLPQAVLPPDAVWPLLAQHPEVIDAALGLAGSGQSYGDPPLTQALSALDTFPTVPSRWLPRVLEFALGDSRPLRAAAQRVLDKLPDIGKRVADVLGSSRQELRIEAARWLARIGYRPAVPALYAALDKEVRETVSAELMTALERLGEDIAPRLAPDVLLQQARKGLKAKPPSGLAWLNLDQLPACFWDDAGATGAQVEPDIIRWWVILAAKLKEPAANALLVRYLGLLDGASRVALGRFVLQNFIAHDTAGPPLEEALAYAAAETPGRYQYYQQAARQYPEFYAEEGKLTEDQIFEQFKRQKLAEYRGSAIGEKGILALICAMPGHELVDTIRLYMRDHYTRRAQIEALLEAASVSDDPAVIQLVLSISRRYRTASVQQKARLLVERIAERNRWSPDQLADRTIPTGGLDETGRLDFAYGGRRFSVVLDARLKPVLLNADGKAIAALPAARQDDDAESIKEGKQLLTTCKKEVKQVVDMQGARLYEAMCAGRLWPAHEWDEYVRRHPVVGRMSQRLVWMRVAADGSLLSLLRPTEDGSLIDAGDEEVTVAPEDRIGLAHASLLDEDQVRAWQAHLKDYKVTPLFAQLARRKPALANPEADLIDDRLGWTSDTFTLRGAFAKQGYARGAAEDGGLFFEYTKDFAGAGLQVRIEFSGNSLPEDNIPAALKSLSFMRLGTPGGFGFDYRSGAGGSGGVPLSKVPPVLLAEAYGDYHAVAAATQGFDPDWQRKMPW